MPGLAERLVPVDRLQRQKFYANLNDRLVCHLTCSPGGAFPGSRCPSESVQVQFGFPGIQMVYPICELEPNPRAVPCVAVTVEDNGARG
jgi:hypothetical protein